MRKLHGFVSLFIPLLFLGLMWPQAQPKQAPSPSATPQATAPATTPGPCAADYYRDSNGVCVHRPVKTQNATVPARCDCSVQGRQLFFSQDRRGTCSHPW